MRKLKLDDEALTRLLDELDAQDGRLDGTATDAHQSYLYRIPNLRVDLDLSRDESVTQTVPTRRLSARGVCFLLSGLVHTNCTCRVYLVTVRNNWQTVSGTVERCRYLPGTKGVYEIAVRFDRPIDPASFAPAATRSKILAVDDSFVSQRLYERLLDTMNADLVCLCDGVEAVERALSDAFDLILMDLEMPGMDGITAVQMLRSKGYVRAIVAVSAMSEPADIERCLAAGCDDFLAKPLTRDSLAEVVNRNKSEPLVSSMLDDATMHDLIDSFVDSLVETMNRLESAYGTQNYVELEREARGLKGEAAGIGFQPITDAAVRVEQSARAREDWVTLRSRLTELIRLCMAARPATSRPSDCVTPALADIAVTEPADAPPEADVF